jgi:molybdopterin synthase catalytic subunit
MMIQITEDPISPEAVLSCISDDANGALVTFVGTVRASSADNRKVLALDIESEREPAQRELEALAQEIQRRWQLHDLAICHRIGRIGAGEIVLVAAIAAPHRKEAFEACQHAVDCMKQATYMKEKEICELTG